MQGDKSTKFFHKVVEARAQRNSILDLHIDGKLESNEEIIKDRIADFCSEPYREDLTTRPSFSGLKLKTLLNHQYKSLVRPFIAEEIKNGHDDLAGDKTPCQDGFLSKFYQFCWSFTKQDFLDVFSDFFQ